jgi:hypothetical protein
MGPRAFVGLALSAVAVALGGCGGQSTLLTGATEQTVVRFLVAHTGFHAHDVRCPSGIPAKVGERFQCRFTGPDGRYVADMRVRAVHGTRVDFFIQTRNLDQGKVLPVAAERLVAQDVARKTGFTPTDVSCPSGVTAKIGVSYDCHFTGPDGKYVARLTILSVQGTYVNQNIVVRRIAP